MIKNALFICIVLAVIFVLYLPSYMQMQNLRHRNEVFEKRIGQLEVDNVKLAEERDRLKNDPEYFEKIARERMGLIREDEVIYKVVPAGTKKLEAVEEAKEVKDLKETKPATKTDKGKESKKLTNTKTTVQSTNKVEVKKTDAKKTVAKKKEVKSKAKVKADDTKNIKD